MVRPDHVEASLAVADASWDDLGNDAIR